MNEQEFGREVIKRLQGDKKLNKWYEETLAHKGFDKTIEQITFSDQIDTEQKVVLSLFIGLSTEFLLEAKKILNAFDEFKQIMKEKSE